MHRLTELFATLPNGQSVQMPPILLSDHALTRLIIVEARVMAGDLFCYALRHALPHMQVERVARLDDVAGDPAVLFYSFINRGCDLAAIEKALVRFRDAYDSFPLCIVTDTAGEDLQQLMRQYDVSNWISASAGFDALVDAIRKAARTGLPPTHSALEPILPDTAEFAPRVKKTLPLGLTRKELDIIRLIHDGKSNKVIAHEMTCSESTVKVHIANMMRKLRLRNRTQLALVFQVQTRDG